MTLDSFRQLFRRRSRPRKRFGPVWHMWQLFLACLPSMLIAISCTYIEKRRLKELQEMKAEAVRERERERERERARASDSANALEMTFIFGGPVGLHVNSDLPACPY